MNFKDNFSEQATNYAQYRPTYPAELIAFVGKLNPNRQVAWDCATGNGQVARELAKYFTQVIATDASQAQLDEASPADNIVYRQASAEQSGLDAQSVDLITVGQALHWFHLAAFYQEVLRVSKAGAYLAVWSYSLPRFNPEIDKVFHAFYEDILGTYWDPERRYIEEAYQTIPYPFDTLETPHFQIHRTWNLAQVKGFIHSWSAVRKYIRQHQKDPWDVIEKDFIQVWGEAQERKLLTWDIYLKVSKL